MRTFPCKCGNTLFFASTHCVKCNASVGRCPSCRAVTTIDTDAGGKLVCGNCGCPTAKCANYVEHAACNAMVARSPGDPPKKLCGYCRFNAVLPDLSIEGNLEKWRRLEAAKHRVLFTMDDVKFPFQDTDQPDAPQLRFEFMADGEEPVTTGHANGLVTINIREADSVQREQTRVAFGEPQRTLVGHFRHELGHYIWDRQVKGQCEDRFRALFGDERNPAYADAMKAYYDNGPKADWQSNYVSAYSTMHPWEDFAETFDAYLDIFSIVSTAAHFGVVECDRNDLDSMVTSYQSVGLIANELNRDMGLLDLVPEVFFPAVVEKLRFVHRLRANANQAG